MRKTYEYRTITCFSQRGVEDWLDLMGLSGWEAFHIEKQVKKYGWFIEPSISYKVYARRVGNDKY